jgi:hypothetical protein
MMYAVLMPHRVRIWARTFAGFHSRALPERETNKSHQQGALANPSNC